MRKGLFMKKSFRILAVMIALTMFVSAFPVQNIRAQSETGTEESIDIDKQVNGIIANMTIEQKLAQMMIIAIRYEPDTSKGITKLTKAYKKLLKKYDFGGLLMYANNMTDINQTVTMIREAQSTEYPSGLRVPEIWLWLLQEIPLILRRLPEYSVKK